MAATAGTDSDLRVNHLRDSGRPRATSMGRSQGQHRVFVEGILRVLQFGGWEANGHKILYINRVCYSPTILAAKVTVLVQLMRIFVPLKRGLVYRIIQTLIWLNISFYLANVLSVILQCSPVPKAWNASIQGHCVNTNLNLIVTGTINVISDVLILLLPLWTIWHLKLPIQKKLSVSAAFAAGILYAISKITFGSD